MSGSGVYSSDSRLRSHVVVKVVRVSTLEVAEACKILENTYRAINIALVNELKVLYDRMGIDVWEVIEAAKTKPFGFQAFYPGPGLGGHCIPVDPFYLRWKAEQLSTCPTGNCSGGKWSENIGGLISATWLPCHGSMAVSN